MDEKKKSESMTLEDVFGPVISSYTSEEAVMDGVLVKTNDRTISLVTRGVFEKCVMPFTNEDEATRLVNDLPSPAEVMQKLVDRVKVVCAAKPADDFYAVDIDAWKFFVERNETGAFTLLFPDEH